MAVYNATPHHTTPHHTTPHHTNFFSPQEHFFVIDSQDLTSIKTKIYGFSVQENGIFDRHNFTDEVIPGLDGTGVYVCIERTEHEIVIHQDFSGNYGLYLYNRDGHFVLSNSFLYLLEYLSRRVRLTLNRDYANYFFIMGLSSRAYSETFINEIELLPRDVIVKIDIQSASITTERVFYGENSVSINSREGMDILDKWAAKWAGIFRNIYAQTHNIAADLSGGLDSRMTFALLLKSGIDLKNICINSNTSKGYTHQEDYAIASEMAEHFGFTLNNREVFTGEVLNYTVEDWLKASFYTRMFVHNEFHGEGIRCRQVFEDKHFKITGYNGENVRAYWHPGSEAFFTDIIKRNTRSFSKSVKSELAASLMRIMKHMVEEVSKKTNIPPSDDLAPHIFRETWGRSHFGTASVQDVLTNHYTLSPLSDILISKLRLNDEDCKDQNLLMAVIYARYCPELLGFRFTKNEKINPETVKFAEKISAQFPITEAGSKNGVFSLAVRDSEVTKRLAENNPVTEDSKAVKYLTDAFSSTALRKLFATCFDEEIYIDAEEFIKGTVYQPMRRHIAVITAAEIIKYIIISEGNQNRTIIDDLTEFAESGFESTSDKYTQRLIKRAVLRNNLATIPGRAIRRIKLMLRIK